MISSLVPSSRFPVGSSASSTFGCLTRALAIATRCCWPPDSSDGRCLARSARPTSASAAAARRRRSAAGTCSGTSAASTFSCALSVGTRLNVWKMNPIDSARTLVTWLSRNCARSLAIVAELDAAGRRPVQPAEHLQQRRLAVPGGALDGEPLAVVDAPGRRPAARRPCRGPSGSPSSPRSACT